MPDDRFIDRADLAHRRHVEVATIAWLSHLEAAGAGRATAKRALVALGQAQVLQAEEVEGLIGQLGLRDV